MNIYLKILKHIPEEHSIIFRYYTDVINEEFLAITDGMGNIPRREDGSPERCRTDNNINIFDTAIISEDDVRSYISKACPPPITWFELQEKIQNKQLEDSNKILTTVEGKTFSFTKEDFITSIHNNVNIEKLLEELLAKESTTNQTNP